MNGTLWNDDTIEYFKKLNKPGCEGDYIRAITDFQLIVLFIKKKHLLSRLVHLSSFTIALVVGLMVMR